MRTLTFVSVCDSKPTPLPHSLTTVEITETFFHCAFPKHHHVLYSCSTLVPVMNRSLSRLFDVQLVIHTH